MEKKSIFLLLVIMAIFVGCSYQLNKTNEITVDIEEICDTIESDDSNNMTPLDKQVLIDEFCKDKYKLDPLCVEDEKKWVKNMDSSEVLRKEKMLKINLKDNVSIAQLSKLWKIHPEVTRYQKDTLAVCADTIKFFLTADFPNSSHEKAKEIAKWLMDLGFGEMLENKTPVLVKDKDSWWNILAGRVIESLCFGETNFSFPCILHHSIDLRARIFTEKFVTYQNYTSYFTGGMHGYNRERLNSFDFIHQENIDWKYLFKEQYNENIWKLMYEAANENEKYKSHDFHYGLEKSDTREMNLGLSDDGIVFSYQPSEIGSFAEGVYHFVISYDKLKPYMTDKAKWCLE